MGVGKKFMKANLTKKFPFNMGELANRLSITRATLYKYFNFFSDLSSKPSFDDANGKAIILGDLSNKFPRLKFDQRQFVQELYRFYLDSTNHHLNKPWQDIIGDYFSPEIIKQNQSRKFNYQLLNQQSPKYASLIKIIKDYSALYEVRPEEIPLVEAFNQFLFTYKQDTQQTQMFKSLQDYIEFLISKKRRNDLSQVK
jgi:hypothetical protein